MPSWEVIVHGHVQGVGFRWYVLGCASRTGIKGYVRNLVDGSVMIIAQGNAEQFMLFCEQVRDGGSRARVTGMDITDLSGSKSYNDFTIG